MYTQTNAVQTRALVVGRRVTSSRSGASAPRQPQSRPGVAFGGNMIILYLVLLFVIPGVSQAQPIELADAAIKRTQAQVTYDPSYRTIPYPNGDVPSHTGVCTDLVIRSYRKIGVDLQKELHEDMTAHFRLYPSHRIWGLSNTDTNIDHRRVPNLRVFFARKGQSLSLSTNPKDYAPGDIVTWRLPGNLSHIGIVTHRKSSDGKRYIVAHNIGNGPVLEDMLFDYPVTGHYRYHGQHKQ